MSEVQTVFLASGGEQIQSKDFWYGGKGALERMIKLKNVFYLGGRVKQHCEGKGSPSHSTLRKVSE